MNFYNFVLRDLTSKFSASFFKIEKPQTMKKSPI